MPNLHFSHLKEILAIKYYWHTLQAVSLWAWYSNLETSDFVICTIKKIHRTQYWVLFGFYARKSRSKPLDDSKRPCKKTNKKNIKTLHSPSSTAHSWENLENINKIKCDHSFRYLLVWNPHKDKKSLLFKMLNFSSVNTMHSENVIYFTFTLVFHLFVGCLLHGIFSSQWHLTCLGGFGGLHFSVAFCYKCLCFKRTSFL